MSGESMDLHCTPAFPAWRGYKQGARLCGYLGWDKRNYFVGYPMPERVAPWLHAYVRGEASPEDETVQMIVSARDKSEGWNERQ